MGDRRGAAPRPELARASAQAAAAPEAQLVIDLSGVDALDTAGAYLLAGLERASGAAAGEVDWAGADPGRGSRFSTRVRDALADDETARTAAAPHAPAGCRRDRASVLEDARRLLGILGGTVMEAAGDVRCGRARSAAPPSGARWRCRA